MNKIIEYVKAEIEIKERQLKDLRERFDDVNANNAQAQVDVMVRIATVQAKLETLQALLAKMEVQ